MYTLWLLQKYNIFFFFAADKVWWVTQNSRINVYFHQPLHGQISASFITVDLNVLISCKYIYHHKETWWYKVKVTVSDLKRICFNGWLLKRVNTMTRTSRFPNICQGPIRDGCIPEILKLKPKSSLLKLQKTSEDECFGSATN